jgi:hypothetical protein
MPYLPNPPGTCPIEIGETAEAYVMKGLAAAESLEFAAHCITCRACATAAEDARTLVDAMKGAAKSFREKTARPPANSTIGTPKRPHRTRRKATRSDFSWFVSLSC